MSVIPSEALTIPQTPLGNARSPRKSILGLDLLRVMAALIVTFHHLFFGPLAFWPHVGVTAMMAPLFWFGWIGVPVFFVISGFVIPYSARNSTLSSFLISRVTRLYPAAWICATITVLDLFLTHTPLLIAPLFAPHLASAWVQSVLLSPVGPWVDGVYWTLAVEMCFYLLVAILLALGCFRSIGRVMGTLGVLSATCWILFTLSSLHILHQHTLAWIATKACHSRIGHFLLLEHGCYFALGTLLWLGFSDRFTAARTLIIAYCLVGGCCEITAASSAFRIDKIAALQPILFWLASMVAFVWMTRYNSRMHHLFGVRGATIVRRLGLMTYPLYLLHQQNGYIWILRLHGVLPDAVAFCLVLFCICVLSFVVNRFAEEPIQRRLKNLFLRGQPRIVPSGAPVAATLP